MTKELSTRFALFLRYQGWLAIYFPLFLLVTLPTALVLDHFFPASIEPFGKPASAQRFFILGVWIAIVTVVVWPVWHWCGDLFLPDRERFKRFKNVFSANAQLRKVMTDELRKNRTDQSR